MELAVTRRWVDAAEALALRLVNRVDEDPLGAAGEIAGALAARGAGAVARVKRVMAVGNLLDRMRAEREANRSAWAQVVTPAAG
jgi:enoyl-CoA hydratase/carnithine racemase